MAPTDTPHTHEAFAPMRSFIFVSVRDDSDLPEAYRWLYKHHVTDSISQFAPYVTQYATYRALPLPQSAQDFGAYNWIMTEHYWLINPFHRSSTAAPRGLAFKEYFDKRYLEITCQPTEGELRPAHWTGSRDGYHPTVFVFLPLFWEDDHKGSDRTIEDGANFRWLIAFRYPPGVSQAQGDVWFNEVFAPGLAQLPQVTRLISSRVLPQPKPNPFGRVAEIWFDNRKQWEAAMALARARIAKPEWAVHDAFPYLAPYSDFVSIFLLDHPESDHLQQYRGYHSTR